MAKDKGTLTDNTQYITHDVLCCTFLLGLVKEGHNSNLKLRSHLQQAMLDSDDKRDIAELTEELKVRGGQDQLPILLYGPVGAGKSAAMKVALRF